jgi:hypothetical protein
LGDHIFNHHSERGSYQDDIHEWFLRKFNIDKILSAYSIDLRDIMHKNESYRMMEQDLPDMCADRIEYNLRGGVVEGLITDKEIEPILQHLKFADGNWFFDDVAAAAKFAAIPLHLTEHVYGSVANDFVYTWAAKAIRRALEVHVVTFDEVHFSTDKVIWDRLLNATDPEIKDCMNKVVNYRSMYSTTSDLEHADRVIRTKFRGVNPLVMVNGTLQRLYDLDQKFAQEYDRVCTAVRVGRGIKFAAGVRAEL